MSQHPSLAKDPFAKRFRSVWKRFERIKYLKEKELWGNGDTVFGLPKIKAVRFKARKEKPKADESAAAEGTSSASEAKDTSAEKKK